MDDNKNNRIIRDLDTKKFEIYDNIIDNFDELENISEIVSKIDNQFIIDNNEKVGS